MSLSDKNSKVPASSSPHERGAFAAWGIVVGGLIGLVVGIFIDRPLLAALTAGAIGWIVGACIDRARR